MDVLVSDLDEHAAGFGEEVSCDVESIAQVREVRVDPVRPRVAEGLDLLGFACDVLELAVLDVSLARGDLPVGSELDAVRRVQVDHLDLAAKPFTLGEAGHDLEAVAEDHSVR